MQICGSASSLCLLDPSVQQVNMCVEFHSISQQRRPLGGLFKGLCERRRHKCCRIITWQECWCGFFLCMRFFFVFNPSSNQAVNSCPFLMFFPGNQDPNMKTGGRPGGASSLKNTGYLLASIPDFTSSLFTPELPVNRNEETAAKR